MSSTPFWQNKPLSQLNNDEWEQICCNCGRCCLIKLQDSTDDAIYYTSIICHLFDSKTHKCTQYQNRCSLVPACLKVTPKNISKLDWMPKTCSYRILYETKDLPFWHPLKGGKLSDIPPLPSKLTPDNLVAEENLEDYIIEDEEF